MPALNIKLYDIARNKLKLTEVDAIEFVLAIEGKVLNYIKQVNSDYKSSIREDILKLKMSLRGEIKESKLDVYKAVFITDVVQLIAILGGILAIVKFMQ